MTGIPRRVFLDEMALDRVHSPDDIDAAVGIGRDLEAEETVVKAGLVPGELPGEHEKLPGLFVGGHAGEEVRDARIDRGRGIAVDGIAGGRIAIGPRRGGGAEER